MTEEGQAIITLISILIALLLLICGWAWFKFMPTFTNKIKGALLGKSRKQKLIEKQFHREFKRNIAPTINENPLIAQNFPETLELIEEYGEDKFGTSLIWVNLIKPVLQGVSMLSPTNPTEQKVVQAANIASSNPLLDMALPLLQKVMTNPQSKLKVPTKTAQVKSKAKEKIDSSFTGNI